MRAGVFLFSFWPFKVAEEVLHPRPIPKLIRALTIFRQKTRFFFLDKCICADRCGEKNEMRKNLFAVLRIIKGRQEEPIRRQNTESKSDYTKKCGRMEGRHWLGKSVEMPFLALRG